MEEMTQYDVVTLPSLGLFYPDKRKTLKVSYLNATDENVLAASNLIQTNEIVDEILRRKIMDKDFDVKLMPEEDKQAVMIFLRNTAFGPIYKLNNLWDDVSETEFESTIDLSEIEQKPFTLIADDNGEFMYELPISKAKIKFVFVSPQMERDIEELKKNYNGPDGIPPIVTKLHEYCIKEVNGIRDSMKIYQFIQSMPLKDSQELRKYIKDNRPGLNLSKIVKTPMGREVEVNITFGVEFFRAFYGI